MAEKSPFEQAHWRLMKTNPVTWDWETVQAELQALTSLDRGRLLSTYWQSFYDPSKTERSLLGSFGLALEHGINNDRRPVFDAQAADLGLDAIAKHIDIPVPAPYQRHNSGQFNPRDSWNIRLAHTADLVCLRLIQEPGELGRQALKKLLERGLIKSDLARLMAARLTNETEAELGLIRQLKADANGVLAEQEIDLYLSAPLLIWPSVLRPYDHNAPILVDDMEMPISLSDVPGFAKFAETAAQFALSRVRAVQSGAEAYRADKLMTRDDAHCVGRAFRFGCAEDAAWAEETLEEIWRGTAFAPDPKAKTLPSQTLTYEIAHAAIAEPRPLAVRLMAEIAGSVRHGSVKKRLTRFAKQAATALANRPERVLDQLARGPLPKDQAKLLKDALEGLLLQTWTMRGRDWRQQMTDPSVWPHVAKLIWTVDGQVVRPKKSGDTLSWRDRYGATQSFEEQSEIALWHPVESEESERQAWRIVLAHEGKTQPFSQAYREIYPLRQDELDSDVTYIFAKHMVAQIPMVGLARRSGFTLGFEDEIDLKLGGQRFRFFAGVRSYPGAGGQGQTGPIQLLGPAKRLGDVPKRVLSEALRRFDLIISVGAAGVKDSAPLKHPDTFREIWPGSQSVEMRRDLIRFARPSAQFDGRWLRLAENTRVHIATGRILRDGTPVDLPKKAKPRATARADDRVMDIIWECISVFGMEEA